MLNIAANNTINNLVTKWSKYQDALSKLYLFFALTFYKQV